MFDQWKTSPKELTAEFSFSDFKTAWRFMNEVAVAAESLNHHPDWQNVYNRVFIRLSTHESGGVTQLDRDLAEKISDIYHRYNA